MKKKKAPKAPKPPKAPKLPKPVKPAKAPKVPTAPKAPQPPNLIGSGGRLFANPVPGTDETTFQVDNTSRSPRRARRSQAWSWPTWSAPP
jgi:hypothetical protein